MANDEAALELGQIQRWNLVVLVSIIGFAWWRYGSSEAASVAIGGAIGAINFWLTITVVRRTFVADSAAAPSGGLLFLKFFGLFGLVGLALWGLQPESTGFAAGFVSVLIAIVLKTIVQMVSERSDGNDGTGSTDDQSGAGGGVA